MSMTLSMPWYRREGVSMSGDTDLQLVERTRAGETEAFSELVRRHERVVFNLCLRYMRDEASANDMAQEAFLKAYRLLKGFRGDAKFTTWLYRVTTSVCLTELSKRKRRGEVELTPGHMNGPEASTGPTTPNDMHEIVRRCVPKLPERYATILTLYYLNEIPYEDIAETMGVPMGTLKTWMHRARNQLRTIVEKELNPS